MRRDIKWPLGFTYLELKIQFLVETVNLEAIILSISIDVRKINEIT